MIAMTMLRLTIFLSWGLEWRLVVKMSERSGWGVLGQAID